MNKEHSVTHTSQNNRYATQYSPKIYPIDNKQVISFPLLWISQPLIFCAIVEFIKILTFSSFV